MSFTCPRGFVAGNQNSQISSRIIFERNGCKEACRLPMRTRRQYIESDKVATIASSAGLVVVVILLFLWRGKSNHSKRQFIISHFIYISIMASVGFLLASTTENKEAIFCRDKATPMAQSDGISVCAVQAALLVFTVLALSLAWLAQLIDLYLKLVRSRKSTENYFMRYLVLIYAYPTLAVIIFACSGLLGYDGGNVYCLKISSPSSYVDVPLMALFLPTILIIISGVLLLCSIAWTIMKAWCRSSISPISTPTYSTRRTVLFPVIGSGPDNTAPRVDAGTLRTPTKKSLYTLLKSLWNGRVSTVRVQQAPESTHAKTRKVGDLLASAHARDSGGQINEAAGVADAGSIVVVEENNDSLEDTRAPSTTSNSNNELLRKRLVATSSLLAFCVLFMFSWAIFLLIKMRMLIHMKEELVSYATWLECVKTHFDGQSDHSWISVCGEQASVYAERYPTFLALVFLSTGQSVGVGVIFISQFLDLLKTRRKVVVDREVVRILQIRRKERHPQTIY